MGAVVTRIEDGFACEVSCADGSLVEMQVADEGTRQRTVELFLAKGVHGTFDGMTSGDLRKVAEGLTQLADAVEGRVA
jgi:hypothetical protein